MLKKLKEKENILFLFFYIIFFLLVFTGIIVHEPWFDEAQHWLIAQDLSILETIKYLHYEGHLIIWYLILMPFAKLNIPYPMPMLIMNALFILIAVFILLKKATFNPILKILIIFSMPIAYQYAVIGRCYSIGILFLFILAAMDKEKFKRPYLYTIFIVLASNTSLFALVGAASFGMIFMNDYIKNKKELLTKEFYILCGIAFLDIIFILYQIFGSLDRVQYFQLLQGHNNSVSYLLHNIIEGVCFLDIYGITAGICTTIFVLITLVALYRNKTAFSFFILSYLFLSVIFLFFYNGYTWHHYFYFVYLIISLWLYDNNSDNKNIFYTIFIIFFMVISCIGIYRTSNAYAKDIKNEFSTSKKLSEEIIENEEIKQGNLITCGTWSTAVVPYLRNNNYNSYDCFSLEKSSFDNFEYETNYNAASEKINPQNLQPLSDKQMYLLFPTNNARINNKSQYYDLVPVITEDEGFGEYSGLGVYKLILKN